jgi:hypothetical protein
MASHISSESLPKLLKSNSWKKIPQSWITFLKVAAIWNVKVDFQEEEEEEEEAAKCRY